MGGESWIINSDHTETAFIANIKKLRAEHGYITFTKPRIGKDRSIDQNSLFYVWITEYAEHILLNKPIYYEDGTVEVITKITPGMIEGMKFQVKKQFNHHHANNFMVHAIINPFTKQIKKGYTSSAKWKRGEMYQFLDWLQLYAANDGLVLEAKGIFAKLKREQEQ